MKDALPPKAGFLATPVTSGLETVTNELALKAVQSEQFSELWVAANRASHKQLVAVLTGSSEGSVSSKDGKVTIDLSQVEVNVKKKLDAKGITVFDKVPAVKGLDFVLFQSKDLVKVQKVTKLLNDLAIVLPIITLLFFAASVVLARNRRRGLVRAATGLAVSMAAVLVVMAVARHQYLSGLSPNQSVAANQAVIDTVTATLRLGLRIILGVSALIAVVALLAGNRRLRAWASRADRPDNPVHRFVVSHRKSPAVGRPGLALLVLVAWSEPTTLVAVVVVAIALVLIGLVGIYGGGRRTLGPVGCARRCRSGRRRFLDLCGSVAAGPVDGPRRLVRANRPFVERGHPPEEHGQDLNRQAQGRHPSAWLTEGSTVLPTMPGRRCGGRRPDARAGRGEPSLGGARRAGLSGYVLDRCRLFFLVMTADCLRVRPRSAGDGRPGVSTLPAPVMAGRGGAGPGPPIRGSWPSPPRTRPRSEPRNPSVRPTG